MAGLDDGIVDISPDVYDFRVYVPVNKKWKAELTEEVEDGYSYWVKVGGHPEVGEWAQAGRTVAGAEGSVSHLVMTVVTGPDREVTLELDQHGMTHSLASHVHYGRRLHLRLYVSKEYKESNEYLARDLVAPSCRLAHDMRELFYSRYRADVFMMCEGVLLPSHASIVGTRAPKYRENNNIWWPGDDVSQTHVRSTWTYTACEARYLYLYGGELPPETELSTELVLLEWAVRMELPRLVHLVQQRLALKLSSDNILQVYKIISRLNSSLPLQQILLRFASLPLNRTSLLTKIFTIPCLSHTQVDCDQFTHVSMKDLNDFFLFIDFSDTDFLNFSETLSEAVESNLGLPYTENIVSLLDILKKLLL